MTFDEILEWAPDNKDVFGEFLNSIKEGNVVPFVGAGMSVPVYPLWGIVLNKLTEKLSSKEKRKVITDILNDSSSPDAYIKAADQLIEWRSSLNILRNLQKIFDEKKIVDADIEKMTVYLLPLLFYNKPVLTTNYDRVLEHAYDMQGFKFDNGCVFTPDSYVARTANQQNLHCLFKIYGDIGGKTFDYRKLIFSGKSLNGIYKRDSELVETLKTFYKEKMMLFLGSSLKYDRTLEILKQVVETDNVSHYAILPCKKEALDSDIQFFGEHGIRAMFYDPEHHEAVKIILEEILRRIDPDKFRMYKSLTASENKSRKLNNPLIFNSGIVGFYGRKDEMKKLQAFATASDEHRSFIWWAVVGDGGSGKTRLVYEFTNKMRKEGWNIEWIDVDDIKEPNGLNYRLTLGKKNIVVADYGRSFARELGRWMTRLARDDDDGMSTSSNRILILNRKQNDNSALLSELFETDINSRLDEHVWKKEFISLKHLEDDFIIEIMRSYARYKKKSIDDATIKDLLLTLEKVDPELKRPLYALLVAIAYCDNAKLNLWDRKEKALDWITKREARLINRELEKCVGKINYKQKQVIEEIRFISTINGDIRIEDIKCKYEKQWESYEKAFNNTISGLNLEECIEYVGLVEDGVIKAVRPDLLGEFYVLSKFENHKDLLMLNGWTDNENLLLFLLHMTNDYQDQENKLEIVLEMISEAIPKNEHAIVLYSILVVNASAFIKDINKRDKATKILGEIYENNQIVVFAYVQSLYNLSLIQPLEERMMSILRIGELSSKHEGNEGVATVYAKGLFNNIVEMPLKEAEESIQILEKLSDKFDWNEEIIQYHFIGVLNLILILPQENAKKRELIFNKLIKKYQVYDKIPGSYDMFDQFIKLWAKREIKRNPSPDSESVLYNTLLDTARKFYYENEYTLSGNNEVDGLFKTNSRRRDGKSANKSTYQKSISAFVIASHAYRAIYEDNLTLFIEASESESRDDITNFLVDKFASINSDEANTLARNIIHIYNEIANKDGYVGAKQQLIYYITRLGIDVSDFIVEIIREDPRDLYIRLSLAYGCVLSDNIDMKQYALAYARSIAADPNGDDAITNRGWTAFYFNDVNLDEQGIDVYSYRDTIKGSWKNSRKARIRRFTKENPRYKDLRFWIFDIPLFHSFLIDRGWDNISDDEYKILESLDFNKTCHDFKKRVFDEEEVEFLTQEKAKLLAEYKDQLVLAC